MSSISGSSLAHQLTSLAYRAVNESSSSWLMSWLDSLPALLKRNGEDIQVLRYEHGQKYDPHYDYFPDKVNIARGGHHLATIFMYLTDMTSSGETVFPNAEEVVLEVPADGGSVSARPYHYCLVPHCIKLFSIEFGVRYGMRIQDEFFHFFWKHVEIQSG
ncbi:hypothetical protein Ahy_B10g106159 isoform B [Arachis hypogaea]|uniref:Fe2OG dioxygenase domain-containing protein n=1 Tax=Arachis hypogaea TaxID=3818 RepID=A0A444X9W5_ARAHY|nr:hypothetical protein Ahy_B10g106159 isoform B [Arachis hypogaea]